MAVSRLNEDPIQITAPHFCAGVVAKGEIVVEAAPILRWSIGKSVPWLRDYCHRKGWKMDERSHEEKVFVEIMDALSS